MTSLSLSHFTSIQIAKYLVEVKVIQPSETILICPKVVTEIQMIHTDVINILSELDINDVASLDDVSRERWYRNVDRRLCVVGKLIVCPSL